MKIIQEFKTFALRGNVIDLAVGVVIGAAFGKIVSALVEDLIMPLIGTAVGNFNFTNLYVPLANKVVQAQADFAAKNPGLRLPLKEAKDAGPVLAWGDFVTTTLDFIIIAFCIFLLVKGINSLKRKEETKPAAPPAPSAEEKLLTEIRDLLKNRV
ncbi:MAG TPA: large conductance mechanosensitive channel protein MscL [Verrucomicrobiae bacterium]|nr:large conductance mechanosensitive channel protein MscL [Verrucomicrobiae bacterium]